jgi:hypothetical protein
MPDLLLLDEPLAGLGWCFYLTRENISELYLDAASVLWAWQNDEEPEGKHPKGKHCGSLQEFMMMSMVGNFITFKRMKQEEC